MTKEQEKINQYVAKYGWHHKTYFNRPHWTRRHFFGLLGSSVSGAFLSQRYAKAADVSAAAAEVRNTAKNIAGTTPTTFNPTTVNGILWPAGLLPKLGGMLSDFAIVRSVRSHALVHSLAQIWAQIGRNPVAVLGNVAPNIGSIVAIEKEK